MYLSNEEANSLTVAIRYFEVGFRSYIARTVADRYGTINDYRNAILNKKNNYVGNTVILGGKISSLLNNMSQDSNINKIYKLIIETNENCLRQENIEMKSQKDDNFLLVSELLAITYIFCVDLFSDMMQKFQSREEYMYLAEQYRKVRNNLFHPEASVSDLNYIEVNKFISILIDFINEDFFWYSSKIKLKKELDNLSISVNNATNIINNLKIVPKQKYRFVGRNEEIKVLKNYLLGNDLGMGRMHYILVSGFGGMGKTALVIEVIMQMMRDYSNNFLLNKNWFDFIFFFSAKEELLDIDQNGSKINKYSLKSEIYSLEDIKQEIKKYLGTNDLINTEKKGLLVIDNFETLTETEKIRINNYIIYESNYNIQYIITSRNEEHIDTNYQLKLKAFNEFDGYEFVEKYLEENSLNINLNQSSIKELVNLSKGNTLILVLSLHRLNQGVQLEVIKRELLSIGSETINNIVSFMSKNSFDEIYSQFISEKEDIEKILQVLVMYDEPIDKFSLMILSHTDMDMIDQVVNGLVSGLILEEKREELQINEFAKTYLMIKFKPNRIEYMNKQMEISNYKRELSIKKSKLIDSRKKSKSIDKILKEWQPNNIIDELAIMDSFEAYNNFKVEIVLKRYGYKNKNYTYNDVEDYFRKIEKTSTHPYIYAQKARILLPLLRFKSEDSIKIKDSLKDSFEKTIISVETQYINIKGTISYASILRELGKFYLEDDCDYDKSAIYSEKAKEIYEKVDPNNKFYYFALMNLAKAYIALYNKVNNKTYILEAVKILDIILSCNLNDLNSLKFGAKKSKEICLAILHK